MIVEKEGHTHKFGNEVFQKVIPLRQVLNEDGVTKRDTITGIDTIYYRKCVTKVSSKDCKETQAFHASRETK
jgi:hypothetical protein